MPLALTSSFAFNPFLMALHIVEMILDSVKMVLSNILYVHDEKFNQPIFHCNNISGHVESVRKIVNRHLLSNSPAVCSVVPENLDCTNFS
ncbi:hypothetical protein Gorai_003359 [Gossypium raimondii]|uniref:Uncharacterized protein n=1 Tax=Gossypium raimondii TaxID=29730 RepID=A0A7J8QPU5_GOSRA|nr:hypothetical protein [Gossypium raimondii]